MKINSSRLSTKNLAALVQRIIALCHSGKYPVVKNHALVAALEEEYQAYDAVYTKQTTSGKGPLIASADEARDRAFASLKGYLKGYAGLLTLPNAANAELLYGIFEEFGLGIGPAPAPRTDTARLHRPARCHAQRQRMGAPLRRRQRNGESRYHNLQKRPQEERQNGRP